MFKFNQRFRFLYRFESIHFVIIFLIIQAIFSNHNKM